MISRPSLLPLLCVPVVGSSLTVRLMNSRHSFLGMMDEAFSFHFDQIYILGLHDGPYACQNPSPALFFAMKFYVALLRFFLSFIALYRFMKGCRPDDVASPIFCRPRRFLSIGTFINHLKVFDFLLPEGARCLLCFSCCRRHYGWCKWASKPAKSRLGQEPGQQ